MCDLFEPYYSSKRESKYYNLHLSKIHLEVSLIGLNFISKQESTFSDSQSYYSWQGELLGFY